MTTVGRRLFVMPSLGLALGLWPVVFGAQQPDRVTPGSARLQPDRLAERTETFVSIRYKGGVEVDRTTMVRTIARIDSAAGPEIRVDQRYDTPRGITTDVTWLDALTLAPRRYEAAVYGEVQTLRFEGTRVTGTIDGPDGVRAVEEDLDGPVFSAVAIDLVYEALALDPGGAWSLPAFNPPNLRLAIVVAVVGEARVPLEGGREAPAWRLRFDPGRGAASDVWVERDTGRLLMLRIGDPASGGFVKARSEVVLAGDGPPPAATQTPQSVVDGVLDLVCQKQIVLLGELPTHGEALAFDAKSRIADRLIEQCGFTAILFESGIYDFIGLERAAEGRTATQEQLDNAIGRFWWTRELTPWRRGLFEGAMRQQVVVGGLDDQVSITSHYARAALPELIASASPGSTATACRQTVSRHLAWTYDAEHPFDERERRRLHQCAHSAAEAAAASRSLDAADRVMLDSFARYADRQHPGVTSGRDDSMYRNLAWYFERLPADSRVVVWTATVHAARQRGAGPDVPLGARVVERWGDRVASVGFTAYAGFTSRAGGPASPIPDAPTGSLEAIATGGAAWALLDAEALRSIGRVPSRLLGAFTTQTWSDLFDAVVVIRQEVAPTFDPWGSAFRLIRSAWPAPSRATVPRL